MTYNVWLVPTWDQIDLVLQNEPTSHTILTSPLPQDKRLALFPEKMAQAAKSHRLDVLMLQEVWFRDAYERARQRLSVEGFTMADMFRVNAEDCWPQVDLRRASLPMCSGRLKEQSSNHHKTYYNLFQALAWPPCCRSQERIS